MNVLAVSVTEPGRQLLERLPYPRVHGNPRQTLEANWDRVDGFVVALALGATVRLIAPLLSTKRCDPAVVCVDDGGSFAIALCGGHAAGGNDLANEVAQLLGATPVVTTASDRFGIPALDQLPGFVAEGAVASVSAWMLAGRPVRIENPLGWPLPKALEGRLSEVLGPSDLVETVPEPGTASAPGGAGRPGPTATSPASTPLPTILVSDTASAPPEARASDGRSTVVLHPASLVVGVGTSSDATPDELEAWVSLALEEAGLSRHSVGTLATIDRRARHPAIRHLADAWGVRVETFSAAQLAAVDVAAPSPAVDRAVGTPSVAEAAALLGAGRDAQLVVGKRASARTTVAIARRARPPGRLSVVGLGPGAAEHRTPAAERAIRNAQVVIGYAPYVEQCRDLLRPDHDVRSYPIGTELDRARTALELAAEGFSVAVVCSGDAGIYAMAGPVFEVLGDLSVPSARHTGLAIEVVPGITAGSASAALLGAPLAHDHVVLSLSDLLTPWQQIEERLRAAAATDLVVVLYNPRSQRRTEQLEKAKAILLEHRSAHTPVGMVKNANRPGQDVLVTTLGELACNAATMVTCIVVGSSRTTTVCGRMVTPRGYSLPAPR